VNKCACFLRAAAAAVAAVFFALASAGAQTVTPPPPPVPKTPNLVWIVADDLGWGDLGCYGQKKIKTPNLDRLAAEGLRFTQFYAGSALGVPSRCALLTGRHTGRAALRSNGAASLAESDVVLPQLLRQAGYRTGAAGKWALGLEGTGGEPNRKGFEEWAGFLDRRHAEEAYPALIWRNMSQFRLHSNQAGAQGTYAHDVFTTMATNFIRINLPARHNNATPFFFYFASTLPHANRALALKTGNGMQVPSDAPYSREPWPQAEKDKAAMITRLDADIGRVLDTLRHHRLEEQTVVIFTSDNGPHAEGGNDPKFFDSAGGLRGAKGDLHEGGIRVPLIVRWTGHIKAGAVSGEPFAAWDLFATTCELAAVKPPADSDGISFLPTLLGRSQTNRHEFFYWELHEGSVRQAIRAAEWKGVRPAPDKPLELFNLAADPVERSDVAAKHPDVVVRLEQLMHRARNDDPRWPLRGR